MIESIGERSQMIKEAVAIATGVDIPDFMVGKNRDFQRAARKVAIEIYTDNLGFMGNNWIADQLGYGGSRRTFEHLDKKRLELSVYIKAQVIYDKMVKEAKQ